jgi:hypothetical protein
MGYFLERGMTRDFSFHQAKPGIEVSVKTGLPHQSIFGAVAAAHQIHSPPLLASAHTAFVNGMDLALLVSGAVALAGLAVTLAFLPSTTTVKATDQPTEPTPRRGSRPHMIAG